MFDLGQGEWAWFGHWSATDLRGSEYLTPRRGGFPEKSGSTPRGPRTRILRIQLGELGDDLSALVVNAGRDHDLEFEKEIAAAVLGNAFAAQPYDAHPWTCPTAP